MSEKDKASLAFPATCILVSLTITSYLHRARISQHFRACKRLVRHISRKFNHSLRSRPRYLHHITPSWFDAAMRETYSSLEPSTRPGADHIELTTSATNEPSQWDSDTTRSDSSSEQHMETTWYDSFSDTGTSSEDLSPLPTPLSSAQPTWVLNLDGRTVLNRATESLPRGRWEIELDERIRNGRGPGALLDRMIDWVVRRVVAGFDADMRAEIERSRVDRWLPGAGVGLRRDALDHDA